MNSAIITQLSESELRNLFRDELQSFFAEMPASAPAQEQASFGGIELAVEVTGLKKPTIYGMVQRREIPYMKKGKRLYFKRAELESWIESGRQSTRAEIEAKTSTIKIGNGRKGRGRQS